MKHFLTLLTALIAVNAYAASVTNSNVGIDQGAARMFIGSGGTFDIESGGVMSFGSVALTPSITELNQLANPSAAAGSALGVRRVARGLYDFSVNGGAIGNINIGPTIPAKAVILNAFIDPITTVTGGAGSSIAITVEAATGSPDVLSLAATSGRLAAGTRVAGIPISAATSLKTTVARGISVIVGSSALTAGKFNVFIEYYLSQ